MPFGLKEISNNTFSNDSHENQVICMTNFKTINMCYDPDFNILLKKLSNRGSTLDGALL